MKNSLKKANNKDWNQFRDFVIEKMMAKKVKGGEDGIGTDELLDI